MINQVKVLDNFTRQSYHNKYGIIMLSTYTFWIQLLINNGLKQYHVSCSSSEFLKERSGVIYRLLKKRKMKTKLQGEC